VTATLPSLVRVSREQRVRQIRRLLHLHRLIQNDRPHSGCGCGWHPAAYLEDGWPAYRDHVADRLADLS
jgi:hypothetical protein